jgi:type VI secretion system protein ImpH
METEIRPTPGAIAAVNRLSQSPAGQVFFETLGRLILERQQGRINAPLVAERDPQAVLRDIAEAPGNYDLFAALRAIECAFRDLPRLGEAKRPRDEPVRIGQTAALAFPASAIDALEPATDKHPPRLMQRVLGLFGPNGALPLHLTEFALERRLHAGDPTFTRFADVFHHRILSLFYRAWANNQPAVSLDRPENDHFGSYIGALCGLGQPTLRDRDSVSDFVKLAHAGIFGRQVKCAEGLQIVLANHFQVPVRLEQWLGRWLPIPESERTRLGRKKGFASLGEDAVIGEKVWDCQSKFRIILGPLSFADYQRFLPNGTSHPRLADLVRLYIGMELDWDIQLVLKKEEVPLSWLGNSVFLGWTSWLGVRLEQTDAKDLILAGTP